MLIAIAGVGLAGLGLAEGIGETATYVSAGRTGMDRFLAIADGRYSPAASLWSRDLFVADCLDLPRSAPAMVQPATRKRAFAEHCREEARAGVHVAPTYSPGWLVIAAASEALNDPGGVAEGLAGSSQSAPEVAWLAERRSALAARHLADLDEAVRETYHRDLAALLHSRAGVEALATRYVASASERPAITSAVEAAPSGVQKNFLDRVRDLSAARGTSN